MHSHWQYKDLPYELDLLNLWVVTQTPTSQTLRVVNLDTVRGRSINDDVNCLGPYLSTYISERRYFIASPSSYGSSGRVVSFFLTIVIVVYGGESYNSWVTTINIIFGLGTTASHLYPLPPPNPSFTDKS